MIKKYTVNNYFSQSNQDKILNTEIFKNKKNGIFIEFGASNGITFSNTYYFEKNLNWTGICIEPIKKTFEELEKNRTCNIVFGAITTNPLLRDIKLLQLSPNLELLSGLVDTMDKRHLERIDVEILTHGGKAEEVTVPCYTLNFLLLENKLKNIDYLSIDTEGGELDIIKSIDFDNFSFHVIGVENNYFEPIFREWFKINQPSYKYWKTIGADDIFINKDIKNENRKIRTKI